MVTTPPWWETSCPASDGGGRVGTDHHGHQVTLHYLHAVRLGLHHLRQLGQGQVVHGLDAWQNGGGVSSFTGHHEVIDIQIVVIIIVIVVIIVVIVVVVIVVGRDIEDSVDGDEKEAEEGRDGEAVLS